MSYILSFRKRNNVPREVKITLNTKWGQFIPVQTGPINYLEIGVKIGGNIVDVEQLYATHPESKMHCIDPWTDYDDYPEYKGQQLSHYLQFIENTKSFENKCVLYRDFSHNVIPGMKDNFFDMVFIDGNHETPYVYNDAVLAFGKTKSGGYIIFDDDYALWPGVMKDVEQFITEYSQHIKIINRRTFVGQAIIQKL